MSVLEERASIDRAIEGMTLVDVLERNARDHPETPAIFWKQGGQWESMSWSSYRDAAREIAAGLIDLGVKPGDFVAIMASNRPEHVIADLGAVLAAATPVTVYPTLAPPQIAYLAGHCEAGVAVLEDGAVLERWQSVRHELPELRHMVVLEPSGESPGALSWEELRIRGRALLERDPGAVDDTAGMVTPDSIATLIYTSGTTGTPKGVVITHRNVIWTAESVARTLSIPLHSRVVSYLPLAHIAERMATHYCVGLWNAGQVYLCADVAGVLGAAQHTHPELFLGVPRIWEKFRSGLTKRLEGEQDPRRRRLARLAVDHGLRAARLEQAGEKVPVWLRLRQRVLDKLVLGKVRAGLGMDQLQLGITAAAPIDPGVIEFFHGVGVPLFELYGMSESCGPATTNRPGANKIGTVGQRFAGVEIASADDGEVMIRGGVVAAGYFKDPEATAEAFTDDGWLLTGDLGEIDRDGFLRIVGRKKDLIITAAGKNIAPAKLEGILRQHPLIAHASLVGEGRPYLTALISLDSEEAPGWAAQRGLGFDDLVAFSALPEVVAAIDAAVDEANAQVARVEQVKKSVVVPDEWSAETGELTPSLKLKRAVVLERYADEIEAMYR